MTDINGIIDKAIEAVVLERDLGERFFEIDRSLLEVDAIIPVIASPTVAHKPEPKVIEPTLEEPKVVQKKTRDDSQKSKIYDLLFLHDRPLSETSKLFMEKALAGLGMTIDEAPLITEKPTANEKLPSAMVYVMMGERALKKFAPGYSTAMGVVSTSPGGKKVVFTHSPDDMSRFASATQAVVEMKKITWLGFKRAAAEAARLKKEKL